MLGKAREQFAAPGGYSLGWELAMRAIPISAQTRWKRLHFLATKPAILWDT
jgi:hypothetical protein